MSDFQRTVIDFKLAVERAIKEGISLTEEINASFRDFKAQQRIQNKNAVITGISRIETAVQQIRDETVKLLVTQLSGHNDLAKMNSIADKILEVTSQENPDSFTIKTPKVPKEIKDEIMADLDELNSCMDAKCYRSAVILCGRILETALHRKYFEVTQKDLLETSPGIGLGNLVAKLSEHDVKLDPALGNQIHLINQVRINSVHQKQNAFRPSQSQAQAIVLYTTDILEKLFA